MPTGIYPMEKRGGMFKNGHKLSKESLKKLSKSNTGKHHTEATKQKIRETNIRIGKTPPSNYGKFKETEGENVKLRSSTYVAIHQWIVREKGRPNKCEHCGTEDAKRLEWANIDHKYKRNTDDYIRLCTKCHREYDKEINDDEGIELTIKDIPTKILTK